MTDAELITRILARDEQALYMFYQTYAPRLLRLIQTKIRSIDDAEEVLQDTLYAFLDAIRDFRGQSAIQTFLFAICNHKIIDYYRRKKLKHFVFSQMPQLEDLVSPLLGPEETLDKTITAEQLKKTFAMILPKYSTILRLKYIENRSVEEIARLYRMTFKSAESQLFRARKAFAKAFTCIAL